MSRSPAPTNDYGRPFQIGEVIAGKYQIESILGEGGMGIVVAAKHLQLDQLVAIKFVLPSMIESKMVVERFLREARAAVRLKSEHAARVLDVDTLESGVPYMVMEYLAGSDLAQVLKHQGAQPLDVAVGYVVQACEAVAEAHARGIVHRDLKPQNLFLTTGVGGQPLVKVLDFGISKMADDYTSGLTSPQMMMGSPQYMAPEQMRASPKVDARADVWSLGVVLYRLISNQLPFGSGPMPELCLKVVSESPRPLEALVPDVPPDFAAIVARCLEKDPEKRYATAGELAGALEPFAPASALLAARRARSASPTRPSMLSIPPASQETATSTSVGIVSVPRPARRARSFILPGTLVVGVAVVAVLTFRGARPPVPSVASAHASASTLAAALPGAVVPPTIVPPAVAKEVAETAGPPSPVASAATAPPLPPATAVLAPSPAAPSPAAPLARAKNGTAPASLSSASPGRVAAKPEASSAPDDDIPSLR